MSYFYEFILSWKYLHVSARPLRAGEVNVQRLWFHSRLHYLIINNLITCAAVPQDDMKGSERQILTGRGRRERQRILCYEFKQSYGHDDIIEILMIQRHQSFSIQPLSSLSPRCHRLEYGSQIRYDHLRAVYQRKSIVVDAPEYQHFPGS